MRLRGLQMHGWILQLPQQIDDEGMYVGTRYMHVCVCLYVHITYAFL